MYPLIGAQMIDGPLPVGDIDAALAHAPVLKNAIAVKGLDVIQDEKLTHDPEYAMVSAPAPRM